MVRHGGASYGHTIWPHQVTRSIIGVHHGGASYGRILYGRIKSLGQSWGASWGLGPHHIGLHRGRRSSMGRTLDCCRTIKSRRGVGELGASGLRLEPGTRIQWRVSLHLHGMLLDCCAGLLGSGISQEALQKRSGFFCIQGRRSTRKASWDLERSGFGSHHFSDSEWKSTRSYKQKKKSILS